MRWTIWAAVFGLIAVALGAFGAHALKERLSAHELSVYETAVRYQFYHVFALIGCDVVQLLGRDVSGTSSPGAATATQLAGWCFAIGIIVFSGSLYALVASGIRKFGAVTPLGGVTLMVGWASLAWAAWSSMRHG